MLKRLTLAALIMIAASVASGDAILPMSGSPLDLLATYAPDADGTHFDYLFTLKLTDADHSWKAGDGWGWIVFDTDATETGLQNFVGDAASLAQTPWTEFDANGTVGDYSGYTLDDTSSLWTPKAVGDSIVWRGVADVAPPASFLWSALYATNDALTIVDKPILSRLAPVQTVPEPTAFAALAIGLVALRRRRR